eukprot:scaffold10883_cov74-Phaeocystis_antarctica.AAC.2
MRATCRSTSVCRSHPLVTDQHGTTVRLGVVARQRGGRAIDGLELDETVAARASVGAHLDFRAQHTVGGEQLREGLAISAPRQVADEQHVVRAQLVGCRAAAATFAAAAFAAAAFALPLPAAALAFAATLFGPPQQKLATVQIRLV